MRKKLFIPALLAVLTLGCLLIMPVMATRSQSAPQAIAPVIAQSPAPASPPVPIATPSPAPTPSASLPNVVLLATGGTIAGTGATSTTTVGYQAAKLPVEALISAVPELKNIANITGEQVLQIASENMTVEGLLQIAKRVNEVLAQPEVSGVVITHGTDTLEETAYFLNLVTKSEKPVVVVGSMRPATALSADGPLNLYNAVAIAGSPDAVGKGVFVSLNDQISAAREVTKSNTTSLNTFQAHDMGYLGYVELGKPYFYRMPIRKHTVATPFEVSALATLPQVDIVYGYGSNRPAMFNAAIADGAKGIIYAGVGNGSISVQLEPAAIAASKKGIPVVRSSRAGAGRVVRNGEEKDDENGFVVADNLSPQKARLLLMLGLTITSDPQALQEMFYTY
ncbi:MAG TPA: asparaginase [Coleofasciculaceae cyanobacterium]